MQFSKTGEYAIRILSFLQLNSSTQHSANTLHKELGIPYKYLTRIMTVLAKKELLVATRGRDGGFMLAKNASEIRLCDILDAVNEENIESGCILGFERCDPLKPCVLHHHWAKPRYEIDNLLQNTTLDVVASSGALTKTFSD